jgi:hypothetical protein
MIPRTYPSITDSNGLNKMVVYVLSDVTGLDPWRDYIPVKQVISPTNINKYGQNDAIAVEVLLTNSNKTPFKDYVPVFIAVSAFKPWKVDSDGFIPCDGLDPDILVNNLELENGDDLLLESGDFILLEQ